MERVKDFLIQTANDYDMDYGDVKNISDNNSNPIDFYDALEQYINNRTNVY